MFLFRYGLFASVSTVLKTGMGKYLQQIVPLMVNSLQSTEGIVVSPTLALKPSFRNYSSFMCSVFCVEFKILYIVLQKKKIKTWF